MHNLSINKASLPDICPSITSKPNRVSTLAKTKSGTLINAGIVFVRKTQASIKFVEEWIALCETGVSDQQELNRLCQVTTKDTNTTVVRNNTSIHVFECRVYNNFYFAKKPSPQAKIKHYKSKLRNLWPE